MKSTMSAAARDYVRAFYRDNRLNLAAALALTVLDVPAALVGSWLLGRIIDVIGTGDASALARLAVFCAAFLAASLTVSLGMYRAKCAFIYRALAQYKSLAFERLSEKGVRAFARENTGSYLSLLTNDVASIEEGYLKRGFLIVYHALLLAGSLAMMLALSAQLTAVAVALSAAPLAVSVAMGREMGERERAVSAGNERFVSRLRDLLAGFSVVKAFRAEAEARRLFDAANAEVEGLKRRRYWWECLIGAVSENLCGSLLQFGVFLAGAWLAVTGEITAGTVLVFVNLCNYLVMPINVLPQFIASRRAALKLVERRISDCRIVAPSDGRLVTLPCKYSTYVQRGELAARMSAGTTLKGIAYVDETVVRKVRIGQNVRISSGVFNRLEYGSFYGSVDRVYDTPIQDSDTNATRYPVEVTIDSQGRPLKLGSSADFAIVTGREPVIYTILNMTTEEDARREPPPREGEGG